MDLSILLTQMHLIFELRTPTCRFVPSISRHLHKQLKTAHAPSNYSENGSFTVKWKASRSNAPRYQCHIVYFSNEFLNAAFFLPFCTSEYLTVHIFDWTAENDTMIWLLIAVMHTITWSCLYGLGHPRQPCSRVTLAELTFHWLLCKIQPTVYMTIANPSRGRDNLGGQVVQPWQAGQLFFL